MTSKTTLILLLSISLNLTAQIGFQPHIVIDYTHQARGVEFVITSDIDGDGDLDVLSASRYDNKIAWYENMDGEGTFNIRQIITTDADAAKSVFAADLDGDGDLDVLSASADNNRIAWYENMDGQGDFGSQQIISNDAMGASSVYAADLDGDGDLDVLSASSGDHKIAWYENLNGQGNFGSEQVITLNAEGATSVHAADIDGDGGMDVLSASPDDWKIAWYKNTDGQGNFGDQLAIELGTVGSLAVTTTDIDNDGDLDVVMIANSLQWYENLDGQGNFSQQKVITALNGGSSVHVGDMDGDGDQDILSASYSSDRVAWYENLDGQGTFSNQEQVVEFVDGPRAVHAADIDSDGDLDVVSGSFLLGKISWNENTDGQGTFEEQFPVTRSANGAATVIANDIDGDGDQDIVAALLEEDMVAWYENLDGQGTFGLQKVITDNADQATSIFSTDLDGDGDADVLSASFGDDIIAWYENLDGQGTFGEKQIITQQGARFVTAADFDGDSDMDVLFASLNDNKVAWHQNDGQGNFGTEQLLSSTIGGAKAVYAVDIDGDGDQDIFAAASTDNEVVWFENIDGQGNFSSAQVITSNAVGARSLFAEDLDGDGDQDLLSVSQEDDKVAWYENLDGAGTFGPQQIITTDAGGARSVYAADLDDDGDIDVLSASYSDGKVSWYSNTDGKGNFGTQQNLRIDMLGANSVFAADMDNDGDIDVLSAIYAFGEVAWYENLNVETNEINGTIQVDVNSNGCDPTDPEASNIMITTQNGTDEFATFSLANGFYQLFPNEGNYSTSISPPDFFTVEPMVQTSDFVGIGNKDIADFCLIPTQTINDLNITLFPITETRPGFDATFQLVYHNVGTTQLDGNVMLEFDDSKLNFLLASENIASQTNNSLTFDYTDLNPFETRTINVQFNILPPPTVNIGEVLDFTATINPITGDLTTEDNVFNLKQLVIGSYDPNDIRVLEGEQVLIEDADEYLHYIIRFQNTGTASAINVRVENVLDDNLDWQTIHLESTSHDNRVEIKDGNQVSFIFNNINLPDSTSNEPESHGFIAYKIKPKTDIQVGDKIASTADIYFDFNEAVVTNTVVTEIVEPVSIDVNTLLDFSIYPVPTSGSLTVRAKTTIIQIEIYNRFGQLVLTNSNQADIDISALERGFYFCKIKDENENSGITKVLKE